MAEERAVAPDAGPRVTVVGAGVIGLSCALRLLEEGYAVGVLARERTTATTSAVAGGFWFPYLAEPRERVAAWATHAFHELARLAQEAPESGVRMVRGTMAAPEDDLWWAAPVTDLVRHDGGITFTSPVVEMPVYLAWLEQRVLDAGGTITTATVSDLDALDGDVVVNATGLGARELVGDGTVYPVQGQVVVLDQCGLTEWLESDTADGPVYVFPRGGDILVGGTAVEHAEELTPDPVVADTILARAAEAVPQIADATVRTHRVGLRPARPSVRLEREGRVVHCYGHGGAGVTLSWGCAEEVVTLVREAAASSARR